MPIRRELLLRTALLRQPDMPPLPPLRAAAQPSQHAHAPRRGAKPGARRRPARLSEGDTATR